MTITCSICSASIQSWNCYTKHLRMVHSLHWCGSVVICGQDGCPRQFSSFNSLRWHVFKTHSNVIDENDDIDVDITCYKSAQRENDNMVDDVDVSDETTTFVDVSDETRIPVSDECYVQDIATEFSQVMADFACKLQAQCNTNMTLVDEIMQMVGSLVQNIVEPVSRHLLRILDCEHPDTAAATGIVRQFETIPTIVDNFSTEHKRLKLFTDNGLYVEPKEYVVGMRQENKFTAQLGFSKEVTVEDKIYFIPLNNLFSVIFGNSRVQSLLTVPSKQNDGILKHLSDGLLYKSNPLYAAHPDSLVLHLYVDAYETTNPLGSHTGLHKMEGLYMVIQNFPRSLTSQVNQIYMIAVWNALDTKNYGYENVLKPVIAMLKELETDVGMPVDINGNIVHMHGSVLVFSADNLGAHSLFGFLESFSARKFCRFCEATKDEVQDVFNEKQFRLRTRDSYDQAAAMSSATNYDQSSTGIKSRCCLHQLQYFHVTENWAPDILHDLLEGVAPFECSLLLQNLEARELVCVDQINAAIQSFVYSSCDRKSKPPSLTSFGKLNMKAADMWCFVRILPVIIGPLVPRNDAHWEVFLLLRDIIDIVFAPVVTVGMTEHLRCLIEEHHHLFKACYPSRSLIPKHHFMIHYPTAILRVGPLNQIWTMRFEAKHQFAKTVMKNTYCSKNVAKTIAKRTQLNLAYSLLTDNLYRAHVETGPGSWCILSSLDGDVVSHVTAEVGLHFGDEIYVANWLLLGHYKFSPGAVVITGMVEGTPIFGRIRVLFSGVDIKKIFIIVQLLKVVCFDRHVYSYNLATGSELPLKLVLPDDLYDCHPLSVQTVMFEGQECDLAYPPYRLF